MFWLPYVYNYLERRTKTNPPC